MRTHVEQIKPCAKSGLFSPFYIDQNNPIKMSCNWLPIACTLMAAILNGTLLATASHFWLKNPIDSNLIHSTINYTGGLAALFFCFPILTRCAYICDQDDVFKSDGRSRSEFMSALIYYAVVLGSFILCNLLVSDTHNNQLSVSEVAAVACCNIASNFIYKITLVYAVKPCVESENSESNPAVGTHYGAV